MEQTMISAEEKALYRRVTARLLPFLFFCFVFAYLDRVNIGFAKLQMQQELGMSDEVYGMGAGIFFIGYFFFEIPCNLMLQRIGAKRWLGPIMIVWGIVSACGIFIISSATFYIQRFVLGVVECGFFPGVILYLTFWFPKRYRARMMAAFMTAIPISGIIGSPVSGWILKVMSTGTALRGWQWLLIIEAVPSLLAGVAAFIFLDDNPTRARWLTEEERTLLQRRLDEDAADQVASGHGAHSMRAALRSFAVWAMCLIYFGLVMGNYGLGFWLPQMVKDGLTKDPFYIGLLSAIPYLVAVVAMVLVGRHSDETGERRWHVALTGAVGAAAFACSSIPELSGALVLVALTVATAGIASSFSTFWALPTTFLAGTAASAGIALINSIGNLAGYFGPWLVGMLREKTQSMTAAMLLLSFFCLLSALLTAWVFRPSLKRLPRVEAERASV